MQRKLKTQWGGETAPAHSLPLDDTGQQALSRVEASSAVVTSNHELNTRICKLSLSLSLSLFDIWDGAAEEA